MDANEAAHRHAKGSNRDSRRSMPGSELFVQSSPRNVTQGKIRSFEPALMKMSSDRPYPDERRPSSASTCGDLEGPHRIDAFKHLGTSHGHNDTDLIGRILSPRVCDTALSQRSRSRTSNMSRKRSITGKQNSKPDPERKTLLMNQVARYWNECIGLADEEKAHAKAESDSLRKELQRQQEKLQEAEQKFETERTNRQALEGRLAAADKAHSSICQENSELLEQVGKLKEEVETSKERAKTLNGKYRTYRAKLNEAIVEQQRLFTQAKDFYNQSIQDLRQEHEARMLDSKAIEQALADSVQKRAKIKECLEELRLDFEQQVQEKHEAISKLKMKSIAQDQALISEKKVSDELRGQLETERTHNSDAMKEVSSSMKELQEFMTARVLEPPQERELPAHTQQRLHALEEAVQNCATTVSTQSNFGSIVQKIEEKIMTEIKPALCDITQCQTATNEVLSLISNGCATELGLVRGEVEGLSQKQLDLHGLVAERTKMLSNAFECIRDGVAGTREVCDDLGQSLESWFSEERRSMSEEQSLWKEDVVSQLTQREKTIDDLKTVCDNAAQMHSTRFEQLSKSLATKEEGKQLAQAMMEEFRFVLDHELCRDKAKAEHDSKQTQCTLANLESQIRTVIDHFEREKTGGSDAESRGSNASSKHMIQDLQAEAKATADLRHRWHSDVKLIDSMRSNLERVQSLMPYIDQCHGMMDSVTRVEDMIEHTSKYIDQEHRWVRHQLQEQALARDDNMAATSDAMRLRPDDDPQAHDDIAGVGSVHASIQETLRRRVHVHSPIEPFLPANAPSIEQEKKRRRDAIKVPSILKIIGQPSSQETIVMGDECNKTETELGPVHEYRKKNAQSGSSAEETTRIIHEIGSSFITEKPVRSAFDLPRITDYQPLFGASSGVVVKHGRDTNEKEDSTRIKRVRLLMACIAHHVKHQNEAIKENV
ncbi:hypothetical protein E4U56_004424 [Claviceps arundinis]|uniref:Uncharacterized protein n=2 Tax=Claviceps arundinis TaxID=1623583 RepID=A0A9P7SRJ7_9HYPO|nr:hypothetical protein E4U56_004424 [Claviceps arundinis]